MQLMTGDGGADRGRLYLEIRNLELAAFFVSENSQKHSHMTSFRKKHRAGFTTPEG